MSRWRRGIMVGALVVGGLAPAAGVQAGPDGSVIPGAWIVSLRDGVNVDSVAAEHGRQDGAAVSHVFRAAFRGYAASFSGQAAARIARDPRVRTVIADRVVSIDARAAGKPGGGGGGGTPPPEVVPTGIARIGGPAAIGTNAVAVAVLDTGISANADLNLAGGYNCSTGKTSSFSDGNGHGTHVAGTIGAVDNAIGVIGVAPGVPLYGVRVLNSAGSGTWSSVICGIDWVTANAARFNIKVANMSLGGAGAEGSCTDGGMHEAICRAVGAGVTFAVAAGNASADAAGSVPASYDEVITVSALADFDGAAGGLGSPTCRTDQDDTFADFSNFGTDVDLIAPGVCILSTWKDGSLNTISGTSMATPHVAGAAALWLSKHVGTPATVKAALIATANAGWDNTDDGDAVKEPLLDITAW